MDTVTSWLQVVSTATSYLSDIDPVMANPIARVGPCTLTPNPRLFETLVDAIISQQISVKAADAIMARLRAAMHAEANGLISPEALLSLEDEALRAAGLSLQKMRYIRDLAERVTSGQLDLERLSELDEEAGFHRSGEAKSDGAW